MAIYTRLEDSLVSALSGAFVVAGTPLLVTLSHENGVEPTTDYLSVNILDMVKQGTASKSGMAEFIGGVATEYAVQSYETLVQLNFYGENSPDYASWFHSQFRANTVVREGFLRNNLAPRSVSNMRRAPQLREGVWVKSFAVDMRVGWAVQTVQDVDWADFVTIRGQTIPLI